MKAVILESYVMEPGDLDWSGVKALVPDTVSYVRTAYEEIAPRIGDADLVLLNKCRIAGLVLSPEGVGTDHVLCDVDAVPQRSVQNGRFV